MTDRFCTGCGADRSPRDQFCTTCGSRWPDPHDSDSGHDPEDRAARARTGRWGRAAAGGVAAALVVGGVFVGLSAAAVPPPPPPAAPTTTTPPPPPDPSRELSGIEAQDRATVSGLTGSWVPQVSSKRVGLRADNRVYDVQAILDDHDTYRARYPRAVLFRSDRFTTYSRSGYYVTVVAQPYPTAVGALRWCVAEGLDPDNCYAVRLVDAPDGLPTVARR